MGPFPHDAPRATITPENPAGTDGFEFVEFAHPDPQVLRDLFARMGYTHTATHKTKAVELWQQGDITYVLNAEPGSFAARSWRNTGPARPSMAWRVVDAQHAFDHAVRKGRNLTRAMTRRSTGPAIKGIGGSLIYFTDQYWDASPYNDEFDWVSNAIPRAWGSTTSIT
jgi:4-hydroxyphenylpyruvate dioxygenase